MHEIETIYRVQAGGSTPYNFSQMIGEMLEIQHSICLHFLIPLQMLRFLSASEMLLHIPVTGKEKRIVYKAYYHFFQLTYFM